MVDHRSHGGGAWPPRAAGRQDARTRNATISLGDALQAARDTLANASPVVLIQADVIEALEHLDTALEQHAVLCEGLHR